MADAKPEIKRQTAFKCSIQALNKGIFVKRPGWESSYLMTECGDFSRVNLIAVVVDKENNVLTLDDGTGKITARSFDNAQLMDSIGVGDILLMIARPREYNNQIYLTIEIIKKIDNKLWINYRRKELALIKKIRDVVKKPSEPAIQESTSTLNSREKILSIIKELDKGEGANIDDVINFSKTGNAEDIVQDLLLRGEIFEIRAGKLKVM
ncbi:TPA: hypothetical protein HA235_00005 [Candidatus Woesearchaeota archaeon]|nr:hypothetical protein [Candidatus Woesearchaeota archaeon]HIH54969.1 hypothetical protein [Candidatus Woesearchaeota archaeon]HIJ01143.1 hypothetical protein [Candidatus Woesearchaeota archaeon]HIJ13385.1 hypothetical protein [Candidatus Woesearchaeota archaeon]